MDQRGALNDADIVAASVWMTKELELELDVAMTAISCNKLTGLEESLWRQETLCAGLKRSINRLRPAMLSCESRSLLRDVVLRLKERVEIYEKLVAKSSRSVAIRQHLCSLYRSAAEHPTRAFFSSMSREV